MKVCLVHDWLVTHRGGEKVLLAILKSFPEADIYTLFYDKDNMGQYFSSYRVFTPPGLSHFSRFRKMLLPLYPTIIEAFDLSAYDLVISSSSCVAKGAIAAPDALHISYIHSPMRYIWDQRSHYFQTLDRIPGLRLIKNMGLTALRQWDVASSQRVQHLIANSSFVKQRIASYYRRDAIVIPPPIQLAPATELSTDAAETQQDGDYYLLAGAFVPYKRLDLAIEACKKLGRKLIVAGFGPLEDMVRQEVSAPSEVIVSPDDKRWQQLLSGAKALVFPGVEDFGMVPVEAMALGTPVIAFGRGGALDYVDDGKTGVLFHEPSADSLAKAIERFEGLNFSREALRAKAESFSEEQFVARFSAFVQQKCKEHRIG